MDVSMRVLGSPEVWEMQFICQPGKNSPRQGNVFDVFILMTSLLCPGDSIGMIFACKN